MTKEQVFKLLDKAISHIDDLFSDDNCDCTLVDQLRDAKLPFSWSVESGISKAVILIKGESYVIKIPFCCMYDEDAYQNAYYEWKSGFDDYIDERAPNGESMSHEAYTACRLEYEKEHPCPDDSGDLFYYELEGATFCDIPSLKGGPDWDYCNLECAIYEAAVEQGLGAYFAEEGWLGELSCGHPVYYQQRCVSLMSTNYEYGSEEYNRKSRKARTTCEHLGVYCFSPIWIADFLECYGEDELRRLNTFLNEMNIGDLREANIGYLDGAPILFDYSGFRHWD